METSEDRSIVIKPTQEGFVLVEEDTAKVVALNDGHSLVVEETTNTDGETNANLLKRWRGSQAHIFLQDPETRFIRAVMKAILFTPKGEATRILREDGSLFREKAFPNYPQ